MCESSLDSRGGEGYFSSSRFSRRNSAPPFCACDEHSRIANGLAGFLGLIRCLIFFSNCRHTKISDSFCWNENFWFWASLSVLLFPVNHRFLQWKIWPCRCRRPEIIEVFVFWSCEFCEGKPHISLMGLMYVWGMLLIFGMILII